MSAARPYCIWISPAIGERHRASYAEPSRFATLANAHAAARRDYPNGRTGLGARVAVGHESGKSSLIYLDQDSA